MITPYAEQAIDDALRYGKAILKFIVPNEIPGMTGGHQCGFYLPKRAWELYTQHAPIKGENQKTDVSVQWQNDQVTNSTIKWYGKGTRSEYRLTAFGRDFPFHTRDVVGDLFVLIPISYTRFNAYILEFDEEIEEIQNALGVEVIGRWAAYDRGKEVAIESPQTCIDRVSRKFTQALETFPRTSVFSLEARRIVDECLKGIQTKSIDAQLLEWVQTEYHLFKMVERKLCQSDVVRNFRDIDEFLKIAQTILQRRKSRAGASLEHHVEHLLSTKNIPFTRQSRRVDGRPDIVIPGDEAYLDKKYPRDRICILGVKTTCKDRWRQVTKEGAEVKQKHLLTLQRGVSEKQLMDMENQFVTLVVPKPLHKTYPLKCRSKIISVEDFVKRIRPLVV